MENTATINHIIHLRRTIIKCWDLFFLFPMLPLKGEEKHDLFNFHPVSISMSSHDWKGRTPLCNGCNTAVFVFPQNKESVRSMKFEMVISVIMGDWECFHK